MTITEEYHSGDIVTLKPEVLAFFDLRDKNYEIIKHKDDKWGMYRLADSSMLYTIRVTDIKSVVSRNTITEGDLVQVVIRDHQLQDIQNYRKYRAKPLAGKIGKVISVKHQGDSEFPFVVKFDDIDSQNVPLFRTNIEPVFKE